jgi:RNA polymerase sigma factor (TIGR02999 family)
MDDTQRAETTQILGRVRRGDRSAAAELLPLVYDQLRALAGGFLRRESAGHTLQPTALVHEAYLRMVDQAAVDLTDRTHFLALAAQMMRRVLVDHARGRRAAKRGGKWRQVALDDALVLSSKRGLDVLALNEALERLATLSERQGRIVEMRFFGGMTIEEVARELDLSTTTVEDEWCLARAWLRHRLTKDRGS